MDLAALCDSWEISLRAEHKSPNTVKVYITSVRLFLDWCPRAGRDLAVSRNAVAAWLAWLMDKDDGAGLSATTANIRYRSLRRFAAWLAEEGETGGDVLAGMRPPKPDRARVPKLADDELAALLATCKQRTFENRRDEAIIRLAAEAMCRADELLSMDVGDVDQRRGVAVIRRGKGGRARAVPFGPQTGRAIDRYLRARKSHKLSGTGALWLGARNRGFGYAGLYASLRRRAERAGVAGMHPHRLRHTGASRWLAAGGSEGGLMAVAGWSSRVMIDRYTEDTAAERAIEESRRLGLGDI